ncbi:hypothetical protein GUJ93_ZPchr0012g19356 [Zizania palustris]|uniref:Uncharacterized protein n=1 Tax=Zizania palustris TaxID=103762 RepID=A0A8J6BSW6_ZIZPA|nr:hypothetical protein GUJ93_ZPchr0012g19356 [Zizania palustris]
MKHQTLEYNINVEKKKAFIWCKKKLKTKHTIDQIDKSATFVSKIIKIVLIFLLPKNGVFFIIPICPRTTQYTHHFGPEGIDHLSTVHAPLYWKLLIRPIV